MVYNVLNKLLSDKRLENAVITVFREGTIENKEWVYGREIVEVNISFLTFRGGETGYEEFSVPLERILMIEVEGRPVFRKKKQIKKIYPRK